MCTAWSISINISIRYVRLGTSYIYFLFFKFFSNVLGYIFVKLFSLKFARISAEKVCDQLYDIFAKPIPQVYLNNQPKKIRKLHSILLWYVFFSPITPIFINWWNQIITDNGKMCQIFAQQRPNQMKTSCQKNSHWLNDHSQIIFWSYCLKHHINDHNDNCDNDDIYIMVKCMSVCMSVTFLLISFSPISGHFWV